VVLDGSLGNLTNRFPIKKIGYYYKMFLRPLKTNFKISNPTMRRNYHNHMNAARQLRLNLNSPYFNLIYANPEMMKELMLFGILYHTASSKILEAICHGKKTVELENFVQRVKNTLPVGCIPSADEPNFYDEVYTCIEFHRGKRLESDDIYDKYITFMDKNVWDPHRRGLIN
jgi:hypothetical protein